jgi:uncharacterized protein with PIN domain
MFRARFHFHGALNDFLPRRQKDTSIHYAFAPHQSLKHLVESLGVPHLEVGLMLVNGQPADGSTPLVDGCQVDVYPSEGENLPESALRFVLDNHLGRLAASLRMLGFDSLYRNDYQDDELVQVAASQERILLTRDRRLLMRKAVPRGYCVRQLDPTQQLAEVIKRYDLCAHLHPFLRCIRCNGLLQPVSKAEVLHCLEPLTRLYFEEFSRCQECDQVYWKGSHYERMQRLIAALC